MGEHVLPGNPPIQLTLRHSARARRISLRVSSLDGRVTLTLPPGVRESEALAFARDKEGWLRTHLASHPGTLDVRHGTELPVEGRPLVIAAGTGRSVRAEAGRLLVPGAEADCAARLRGWLRALARTRLAQASDRYAAVLGRPYAGLAVRDTRSRWGSCSARGTLSYSWRLVMAPPEVLDYVAAHEVAHLEEMNHSRAFWAVVERLHGPFDGPRRWLRRNGPTLHRYRF
ncbi:M48 family metallopeptidase [Rhodosalinus sp. K401]|uniref:M48 family metallopeptidase n=1 Tax=Rhodosalinus sp. K401 TaxID=3239195 RepID=UPI00352646EC